MNTNTKELNINEMEQVNGGFSFEELLVKTWFYLFKPAKKVDTDENRSTDLLNLCAH